MGILKLLAERISLICCLQCPKIGQKSVDTTH